MCDAVNYNYTEQQLKATTTTVTVTVVLPGTPCLDTVTVVGHVSFVLEIFHHNTLIIRTCSVMRRPPPRDHLGRREPGLKEAGWLLRAESGDTT